MSTKRKVFIHVGLPDGPGDFLEAALDRHRHPLAALGVRDPADSADEMFRAAIEILRDHRAWGYERREVEGAWSGICRRARKGRDTLVVSQPLLACAPAPQIELLFDGLAGFERHVVITASAPDAWTMPGDAAQDLGCVLERWAASARKPERVHVLVAKPDDRAAVWTAFGRTVGFGTASLSVADLPTPPAARRRPAPQERLTVLRTLAHSWIEQLSSSQYDVRGDVTDLLPEPSVPEPRDDHELRETLHELERLSRRNQTLEQRMAALEKRRRTSVA